MNKDTLKSEIKLKAEKIYKSGIDTFKIKNPVKINFNFSLRGRVAGTAESNGNINYNLDIANKNYDIFINDTVPHEVAHVICFQVYPYAKPHGREWKSIIRKLGYNDNRCHSMEYIPARQVKKYSIYCTCQKHDVGAKIYKNISNGSKYTCTKCKGTLKLNK